MGKIGFCVGLYWVCLGVVLGLYWVCIGFGSGLNWVCFFCVFLDRSHCNSLSYQVLQTVGASENWVCLAYKSIVRDRILFLYKMYKMNNVGGGEWGRGFGRER